jgi:hypothetical protein
VTETEAPTWQIPETLKFPLKKSGPKEDATPPRYPWDKRDRPLLMQPKERKENGL